MKKYIFLSILLVLLVGCDSTPTVQNHSLKAKETVAIVGQVSNYPFEIIAVKSSVNDNGFLEAQIEGKNHKNNYHKLEYRVDWFNQNGILSHSIANNTWNEFPVFSSQLFVFSMVSPNLKTTNFRVYIRDPKRNSYEVYNSEFGE